MLPGVTREGLLISSRFPVKNTFISFPNETPRTRLREALSDGEDPLEEGGGGLVHTGYLVEHMRNKFPVKPDVSAAAATRALCRLEASDSPACAAAPLNAWYWNGFRQQLPPPIALPPPYESSLPPNLGPATHSRWTVDRYNYRRAASQRFTLNPDAPEFVPRNTGGGVPSS
eukprot:Gregarina_sp_Poly_1__10912@NODE_853_length_5957_cov_31_132767_g617_i0_p6_GENE_NODE_853_length_5957_cov_31_132767_g617_i0NODE_853_length_5957_cov_31_132767_g617_i0_p6_ORF_typecomplete_len172_score22_91PAM2/PF07145_15/7_2e06PAM2/PF07145_15/8_2e03_NODE_853_length_5957_cov_31_132767_g617_i0104619